MRKILLALPALAVAIGAVATSPGTAAFAAPVSLTVTAGDGEPGYAVNTFLPSSVYIYAGDTLTWEWDWPEPHSITFGEITGNPEPPSHPDVAVVDYDGTGFVNSGILFPGPDPASFAVKFTDEGVFDYYCIIHPFMTGKVYVQGPGVGVQDTQVALDARGAVEYNDNIAALKAAAAQAAAKPVAVSSKAGGGREYTLQVSSNNDVPVGDVMQFFPASLNVGLNDSVKFVSNVHTPHNIAFIPPGIDLSGPPPPELADWDPFESGVNYTVGVKLDNTKFVASPIIGHEWPDGLTATFAFAKTGTYNYVCILHAEQAMAGTINVTAGAPGAPSTGDTITALPVQQSGTLGILLVMGAVAIAMGATTVAFAASRR
jgi:plastocyanin